jgi:hypothetical protein
MFTHLLGVVLLHLLPRSWLLKILSDKLSYGSYRYSPCFSGRVTIYKLAVELQRKYQCRVALLPDYVCNVVYKALVDAGYECISYSTDSLLEAKKNEIIRLVEEHKGSVLIGASVYGSSGLLRLLQDKSFIRILKSNEVHTIVDIAQDITLRYHLPESAQNYIHGVVSFNNKSFPGILGGGVLSSVFQFKPTLQLSMSQLFWLYKRAFFYYYHVYLHRLNRSSISKQRLDYSYCNTFPWFIIGCDFALPKISIIFALLGIMFEKKILQSKYKFISLNLHKPTCYANSATYLMISSNFIRNANVLMRKRKNPYAVDWSPQFSLRSDEVVVHNKGYFDLI